MHCDVYMAKILVACLKHFYHNQLPYTSGKRTPR